LKAVNIMAVPKQRQNKSRRDRRRGGQKKLKTQQTIKCSNCGMPVVTHRACSHCGFYKGKQVVEGKNLKLKK
jgi:large subunit ribosomal protein L32